MPEGPSIVILREHLDKFIGQKVLSAEGNAKIDYDRIIGQKVVDFKSWGKHFLICFDGFTLRVHFLMFGTYLIDARKDRKLRLGLTFANGELNLYTAAVKMLDGKADEFYDWSSDVLSPHWSPAKAKRKLRAMPEAQVGDVLLDQDIFSGVGNIIRNEALHRIKVHPESLVGKLTPSKLSALIKEARAYSFDFLKWRKEGTLKRHWQAYHKKECGRCGHAIERKDTGKTRRSAFFCVHCQKKYVV